MKRDTRNLLIDVAAELLDQGGSAAVTLREVGKRAGVSHNAPYRHFKSKEDLLAAIASRELRLQSDAMTRIGAGGAIRGLRRLIRGYIARALSHPARFRLTFGPWTSEPSELTEAATQARRLFVATVQGAQASGDLPPGEPDRLGSLLLAASHGIVELELNGHLSGKGKRRVKPEALVDDLLDVLCRCGANRPGSR